MHSWPIWSSSSSNRATRSAALEIEHRRLKRERATQDSAARRQNLTTLLDALQAEELDERTRLPIHVLERFLGEATTAGA